MTKQVLQTKFYEGTSFDNEAEFCNRCEKLGMQYLLVGREICPTTNRPHLQFVLILKQKTRPQRVGKVLGCTVFPLRRDLDKAIDYIIENPDKPNPDYFEIGPRPSSYHQDRKGKNTSKVSKEQGVEITKARNAEILHLARTGSFDILMEKYPGRTLLSYNVLKKIWYDNIPKPKKDLVRGLWIEGPTGCGKSYWMRTFAENERCYPYNRINSFFERYNLESILTIDDLDTENRWMFSHLKVWCNENTTLLNVKGSSCWSYFERVIITSQYEPRDIVDGSKRDEPLLEAIQRRFIHVKVISRDERNQDLYVVFADGQQIFPFSLNNYLECINFF